MKSRLLRWTLRLAGLLVLMAVTGLLVAASGLVPIKASAGHWRVTEWFLQFTMRRSVATHTLGVELPSLDEPWLVTKGAGHYETACRPCHGSPDHARSRITAAMLPPPPYLPPLIAARDPEALFYIVKHGIKFTGMPAWPSQQRDDEVHAMVAFLLELPSLDAGAYRRLVDGDTRPADPVESLRDLPADVRGPSAAVIASCARCHGASGRGRGTAAFPKLAGQKREYMIRALMAYDREHRHSGIMGPIAAGLSRDEQRDLADHYSSISGPPLRARGEVAALAADPRVERGRAIARDGIPGRDVPPCNDCHDSAEHTRNEAYPILAGQFAEYLVLQLEIFSRGERGGSEYAHIMQRIAKRLTLDQMRDAAAYYGSFVPEDPPTSSRSR